MFSNRFVPWLVILCCIVCPQIIAQPADSERVVKTGEYLDEIQSASRIERLLMVPTYISIGAITMYLSMNTFIEQMDSHNDPLGCLLIDFPQIIFGGFISATISSVFLIPGILIALFPPDSETLPDLYRNMKEYSEEDLYTKAAAGEEFLVRISSTEKTGRIFKAIGFLAFGAAGITVFAFSDTLFPENTDAIRYWSLSVGILFSVISLSNIFIESAGERSWKEYLEWKAGRTGSDEISHVSGIPRFFISPVSAGVVIRL
ncbi:MAG: hypothetical protein JW904_15185 [Spirochaetales bacterium]|nr:hypothetical protein [Spirochaetales bacterium]